jgi:tyrosine decarboxylase/aspartate 1-decarboxylase
MVRGRRAIQSRPHTRSKRSTTAIPDKPLPRGLILSRLRQARSEDWTFGEGRIFGSMCTEPLPLAREASNLFPTANLGNPGLCPGTSRLEEEVVAALLDLYHAPTFGAGGYLVTGGTEANITALWIARNVSGGNEVVLPRSAHFSVVKAMDMLSLKPIWIPVGSDGRMDVSAARRSVGKRTAAIVGVAGSTELGAVDPIEELSEIALAKGLHLHVDAAFGGFVLPFLKETGREEIPFDFALKGVTSLASDPHKMGMAPLPSGVLLLRRVEQLQAIMVASPYLSAPLASSLLGTRPSRNVSATYAAMMSLGREGYSRNVRKVLELTKRLIDGGVALGLEPVIPPVLNIVAFRHSNPIRIQSEMLKLGWDVSAMEEPPALRFVVMPHVTERTVALLLKDLAKVLYGDPNLSTMI